MAKKLTVTKYQIDENRSVGVALKPDKGILIELENVISGKTWKPVKMTRDKNDLVRTHFSLSEEAAYALFLLIGEKYNLIKIQE